MGATGQTARAPRVASAGDRRAWARSGAPAGGSKVRVRAGVRRHEGANSTHRALNQHARGRVGTYPEEQTVRVRAPLLPLRHPAFIPRGNLPRVCNILLAACGTSGAVGHRAPRARVGKRAAHLVGVGLGLGLGL
eukprot:scaffold24425_cov66-Phaeocystis_antarctica.AAC.5